MTHSLHREGDAKSLENDYVILITPAIGVNDKGSGPKLKRCLKILLEEGVANIGDVEHGSVMADLDSATLESYLGDGKRIRACVSDMDKLKKIVGRLKEEDLGLSLTVSGLIENIYSISKELDIKPHTINMSLGVWGRTDLLPSSDVLELTTMCGHHMISRNLVENAISKIKEGKTSPKKATEKMGKLCVCGIFNPDRCESLLKKYVE